MYDKKTVIKRHSGRLALLICLAMMAFGYAEAGEGDLPEKSVPDADTVVYRAEGKASYYAAKFHGRRTSSGERLDNQGYMAAHPYLPFGTVLRVTSKKNGKSVLVKVSDRFRPSGNHLVDITRRAAEEIGIIREGIASVTLEVLRPDVARKCFNPDTVTLTLANPKLYCPVPARLKWGFPERLDLPEEVTMAGKLTR